MCIFDALLCNLLILWKSKKKNVPLSFTFIPLVISLKKVGSEALRKIYLCFNKEDENIEVHCYNVFNFIPVICDISSYELYCV